MSEASQLEVFHPGFGEKLKVAREALGLTHVEVAAKLKLGARQIEALEAEDLAHLPGDVFTRGFIRNYARLVDVDPELLIVPLDIHAAVAETITAPSEGVIFTSPGLRRWVLLPLLGLGFFVVLVAVLYYWLRQGENALIGTSITPTSTLQAPVTPHSLPPSLPLPGSVPEAVAPISDVEPATPPIPAPSTSPISITPVLPVAPLSQAAPASQPDRKIHTLRFSPTLDAWIQVVDGKGQRYSKLVRAGSTETFSGEAPFKLVVGEAAQVKLSYDGHFIDLAPFIGQKVARLTLE